MANPFAPDAPDKDLEQARKYTKEFILSYRPGRTTQAVQEILEQLFVRAYQDGARAKFVEMTTRRSPSEEE